MDDTYFGYTIKLDAVPKNIMELMAKTINGRIRGDCIIHPEYPNKYIQLDYHPNQTWIKKEADNKIWIEIFLKAFGAPSWTSDDINRLISIFNPMMIHIPDQTFAVPALRDRTTRSASTTILDIFPIHVKTIIFGYGIIDCASKNFGSDVVRMFKQMYFREQCIDLNGNKILINDGSKLCTITDAGVEITLNYMRFAYTTKELTAIDVRSHERITSRYKNGTYTVDRPWVKKLPPKFDDMPKLSIDVINIFDPSGEFGLRNIFAPFISQDSYVDTINDLSIQKYVEEMRNFFHVASNDFLHVADGSTALQYSS